MELYVVRHGIAEFSSLDKPDEDRALTPKGRKRTREVARGLRAIGCRPKLIATSPLVRAEQTARILADVLKPKAGMDVLDFLAPGAAARDVARWLRGCEEESAMIVGHAPDVSRIAGGLLTRGRIDIPFKKAAVCGVAFEDSPTLAAGSLLWMLPPNLLRALGAGKGGAP